MKYLIMTEGTCEKALLDVLIEKDMLKYDIDDLLYREVFHSRQIDSKIITMINQLSNDNITIIRVGDKLSDALKIPEDIEEKICKPIINVCIKPELEILIILKMKQYKNYLKKKSNLKPCEFLKTINKNYTKSYNFLYEYFSKIKKNEFSDLLKRYDKKRGKTHKKHQERLTSLIRDSPLIRKEN